MATMTGVGSAGGGPEPLRVLMINTVPMRYEGITMVMLNYARSMDHTGLRLDFLAINDVEPSLREAIARTGARLHVIEQRNRRPLRYLLKLARLIRENGYQVVHAHGNSCTLATELAAALLGGARVRCAHSHNTTCNSRLLNALLTPPFRACLTHGFACGEAAGRWLFGKRPFTVLNNGVDAARFRFDPEARAACRQALGLDGGVVIGHAGSFSEQKNHAFLIEAFARAAAERPDLTLALAGEGPLRPETEALVREKGLTDRVRFLGVRRDMPAVLSAMDLMVLPSLFEGLPNVIIEAQASGLPALAADTVTRECRLTPLVDFLPLDIDAWSRAMAGARRADDRTPASADAAGAIARAGYDIRESAARLRALYFEYARIPAPR